MSLHFKDRRLEIHCGNALSILKELPAESVQCCVTSPPYFGLRDYGCDGQLGLEKTPEEYVENMRIVFSEVRRVLKKNGTLWLNLGDSYCNAGTRQGDAGGSVGINPHRKVGAGYRARLHGLKQKDLVGIPWRVAFALQSDGWYLRSDIIWNKPNPMPESVTDRPTKSHEYIFLLTKSEKYFYDSEAIKEPFAQSTLSDSRLTNAEYDVGRPERGFPGQASRGSGLLVPKCYRGSSFTEGKKAHNKEVGKSQRKELYARNKRTVWTVTTKPFKGAHFAVYPTELISPCIQAGSKKGDVVLDPFSGSGTTGEVALGLGRNAMLIELNPEYLKFIDSRTMQYGLPMEVQSENHSEATILEAAESATEQDLFNVQEAACQ